MENDPYDILGVPRDASLDEIKAVFRGLAKKYHPDVSEDKEVAHAKIQEIIEAYRIAYRTVKNRPVSKQSDAEPIDFENDPKYDWLKGNAANRGYRGLRQPEDDLRGIGDILILIVFFFLCLYTIVACLTRETEE